MTKIIFEDVTLRYPIYDSRSKSLRNQLIKISTGGLIEQVAGKPTVITALKNVNFELKAGDAVGIIGHNGSGKSTLLKTIAGIYVPESGRVIKEGKISTVFEIGAGLNQELTGYENIINLGMMMGYSLNQCQSLIPDIEEFTELGDFLQLPIRTYSSGMIMRLMFAVATAVTPEILLIDEMISTGDKDFQQKSQDRIKQLISSTQILVIATHDMRLIKAYCNRAFILEHGQIQEVDIKDVI